MQKIKLKNTMSRPQMLTPINNLTILMTGDSTITIHNKHFVVWHIDSECISL